MKNPHSRTKLASLLAVGIALAWFARPPTVEAVSPPPDGGYANFNTAEGTDALFSLTTGALNTANGYDALYFNTTGGVNTANGYQALYQNTTGTNNTATGVDALFNNTIGDYNTADGVGALLSSTTGNANTANGFQTLRNNTAGASNTANGYQALFTNTAGNNNTANGGNALLNNSTGSSNIALGFSAGSALTTGSNNIDIGNIGAAAESGKIRIGTKGTHKNAFIAGVSGVTIPGGVGVIVDTNGHLGTIVSSARFKDDIQPMDKAGEAILALQPVTFHYKKELDPAGIRQFGLVAEQVENVNPDLVARDEQGKPYTVRYEAVNAMLLNEFLKEHRKVEALEATIATQQKGFESQIAALTATLKAQAAQIQRVSDRLRTQFSAPRVVSSN